MAPPPPAPPPPGTIIGLRIPPEQQGEQHHALVIQMPNDECAWALGYPNIQKGCFLGRVCQYAQPKQCQYYEIGSLLQVGPTCGLTALSMMLNGEPTPEDLLADARKNEYTLNGEMFSAQYLYELTRRHLAHRTGSCQLHEGALDCDKIKKLLRAGGCLLVPYDADTNHAPCLKFGHRAHWALVVGFLVDENDEFYVLARHGKTRNLAVWSLATLSESNGNLTQFAQPKGYPDCTFQQPEGGLDGPLGLKNRCILINGLPQQIVHVC
ncbi:actin maturation protease [Drosophila tropicalis]|uniref:actin maturation protease n=1 Tax=Drosophila tropicalis TaxID=46794 RepID=UPI0035AB87AE